MGPLHKDTWCSRYASDSLYIVNIRGVGGAEDAKLRFSILSGHVMDHRQSTTTITNVERRPDEDSCWQSFPLYISWLSHTYTQTAAFFPYACHVVAIVVARMQLVYTSLIGLIGTILWFSFRLDNIFCPVYNFSNRLSLINKRATSY